MRTATLIDPKILLELTRKKIDIDTLVDELEERHVFDEDDEQDVLRAWKKIQVRKAIKSLRGEDGLPLIFSIAELGPDGKEVRTYKQELLFNIDDYKQAIETCRRRKGYWNKMERKLISNARVKFGEQTKLFG